MCAVNVPWGASGEGGMYATALTYLLPARKMVGEAKGADWEGLDQEMAVVSLEAERTRVSIGEATARTYIEKRFNRSGVSE